MSFYAPSCTYIRAPVCENLTQLQILQTLQICPPDGR